MASGRDSLIRLINESDYQTYAEIGVFRGKTARRVWSLCPTLTNIWLIDPWSAERVNQEVDGRLYVNSRQRERSAYIAQCPLDSMYEGIIAEAPAHVCVIRECSQVAAASFSDESLDIVFIDASHFYEDVRDDIETWLPKVRSGGVLCGDDITKNFPGVRKAVEERFEVFEVLGGVIWSVAKKR
jgi:hypothetical protein